MSWFNALGSFAGGAAGTYFRNGLGDKWEERRKARELSDVTKEANGATVEDKSVSDGDIARYNAENANLAAEDEKIFGNKPADVVVSSYVPGGAESKPVKDMETEPAFSGKDYEYQAPVSKKEFAFMGKTQDKEFTPAQQDRMRTDKIADTMRLQGDHKGAASLVATGYGLREAKRTEENSEVYSAMPGRTLKDFEAKSEEALKRGDDAGYARYKGFADRIRKGQAEGETELAMRVYSGRVGDPAALEDMFNMAGELRAKKGTGRVDENGTVYGELEDGRKVSMTKAQAYQHLVMVGKIKPEKGDHFAGTGGIIFNKQTGEVAYSKPPNETGGTSNGSRSAKPKPGDVISREDYFKQMGIGESSYPEAREKATQAYTRYGMMLKNNPDIEENIAFEASQSQAKPMFDKKGDGGWRRGVPTKTGTVVWVDAPNGDPSSMGVGPEMQREEEMKHPNAKDMLDDAKFANLQKAHELAKKSGTPDDIAEIDRALAYGQRVRSYPKSNPAEKAAATKAKAPLFSEEELAAAKKSFGVEQSVPMGQRVGAVFDSISSGVGGIIKQGGENLFSNTLNKVRTNKKMDVVDAKRLVDAIKSRPELKENLSAEELIAIQVAANTRL